MSNETITVVSWNVQGENKSSNDAIQEQVDFLKSELDAAPDIINFQAVACHNTDDDPWYRGVDYLRSRLAEYGLGYMVHSCDWAAELADSSIQPHPQLKTSHERGNVTASKYPLRRKPLTIENGISAKAESKRFCTNFPERILVSEIKTEHSPGLIIENWNVGVIAGRSWGEEKIKILETMYSRLSQESEHPRILSGDLNTPNDERNNSKGNSDYITYGGRTETQGQEKKGDLKKPKWIAERWKKAESRVLKGCNDQLTDAFRQMHGDHLKDENGEYNENMYSHKTGNTKKRIDHIFSEAKRFEVHSCKYLPLDQAPSDHAPIIAELKIEE